MLPVAREEAHQVVQEGGRIGRAGQPAARGAEFHDALALDLGHREAQVFLARREVAAGGAYGGAPGADLGVFWCRHG